MIRLQEDEVSWQETEEICRGVDLFYWVSTYGYALNWNREDAFAALRAIGERIPTVGSHLDLWWGLERQAMVYDEPYFQGLQMLFTADGDHDEEFRVAGVNHRWLPPGCFGPECAPGSFRPEFASEVAFIGSWRSYGHPAWWPHRKRLLGFLRRTYGPRMRFWPQRGPDGHFTAVRGQDLNDVLASTRVIVGDSCLANTSERYFSDRLTESIGRGGFLLFPYLKGIEEIGFVDGEHLRFYRWGDWNELKRLIDHYLQHDEERERIRRQGQDYVREFHTYERRMQTVLDTVFAEVS